MLSFGGLGVSPHLRPLTMPTPFVQTPNLTTASRTISHYCRSRFVAGVGGGQAEKK